MIRVRRVYEPAAPNEGSRFLVDGLWPPGMSRAALGLEAWLRDLAPSTALRRWFGHQPSKWSGFRARYFRELEAESEALTPLIDAARRGTVTLLYAARDPQHNNAVAIRDLVLRRLQTE